MIPDHPASSHSMWRVDAIVGKRYGEVKQYETSGAGIRYEDPIR